MVEEEAGEQSDADAEFEDVQIRFQRAGLVGLQQRGVEDVGGVAGEGAVVVDDEGDGGSVGDEGLVAALRIDIRPLRRKSN